ncbi:Uncharacterised protein [Mycobacterium tuberculosis]|nr:Uncharacterised protein [Mycobacterium tuberculosis]
MAEAQLPDSKLMKLAGLPEGLSGCPPELYNGPPRNVASCFSKLARPSAGVPAAALAASVAA